VHDAQALKYRLFDAKFDESSQSPPDRDEVPMGTCIPPQVPILVSGFDVYGR
jgi:hypothetical protein